MRRRTWTALDPEPDDRPHLVDDLGHFWIYDHDGDDIVGADEERNLPPGWFSPLLDSRTCTWSQIFTVHDTAQLTEITDLELEQLEADLLGWHSHYPGHEDPAPAPRYCPRCLGEGVVNHPHAPTPCPRCVAHAG